KESVRRPSRVWDGKNQRLIMKRDENGRPLYVDYSEKYIDDVWSVPQRSVVVPGTKEYAGYSTQKPLTLLKWIIEASCPEEGCVADFFSGSGTTGVAASMMGRRWIMCEKQSHACVISIRRLVEASATFKFIFADGAGNHNNAPSSHKTVRSLPGKGRRMESASIHDKTKLKSVSKGGKIAAVTPTNELFGTIYERDLTHLENGASPVGKADISKTFRGLSQMEDIFSIEQLKLADFLLLDMSFDGNIFRPQIYARSSGGDERKLKYLLRNISEQKGRRIMIWLADVYGRVHVAEYGPFSYD
ncbi:MAG: site-specific DNA-methyltransferase, partial [Methanomassiliicoccales archaeon]